MDRDIGYFLSGGRGPAPPVITGPWEYVTIRGGCAPPGRTRRR